MQSALDRFAATAIVGRAGVIRIAGAAVAIGVDALAGLITALTTVALLILLAGLLLLTGVRLLLLTAVLIILIGGVVLAHGVLLIAFVQGKFPTTIWTPSSCVECPTKPIGR